MIRSAKRLDQCNQLDSCCPVVKAIVVEIFAIGLSAVGEFSCAEKVFAAAKLGFA